MKKYFLFFVFLLSASIVFAGLDLGVKVGYNAAKLSTSMDSIKTSFKSGFQFGAFVRIGKRLYVQPEAYYTTQGGVFTSNVSNWKQNVKLGSVDIPVLLGFKIINNDNLNLRILAGPAASIIVNKTIENTGNITDPITKADINTVNWNIQAGAGVDIWKFTFDIRYQIGLNQLIKDIGNKTFNSHNNVWVVSLGFKIF